MTIAIGADHGGYSLKRGLARALRQAGYRIRDLGTHGPAPCDYPRVALTVAAAVSRGQAARGVLICKSGVGMAIAANKVPGVRAAVVATIAVAKTSRQHNDANVLVLGAVGLAPARAKAIVAAWLDTPFAGGRHARRVRQITRIEHTYLKSVPGTKSRKL